MNKKQGYKYNKHIFYSFIYCIRLASYLNYYQIVNNNFCDLAFKLKYKILYIKKTLKTFDGEVYSD